MPKIITLTFKDSEVRYDWEYCVAQPSLPTWTVSEDGTVATLREADQEAGEQLEEFHELYDDFTWESVQEDQPGWAQEWGIIKITNTEE